MGDAGEIPRVGGLGYGSEKELWGEWCEGDEKEPWGEWDGRGDFELELVDERKTSVPPDVFSDLLNTSPATPLMSPEVVTGRSSLVGGRSL